MIPESIVVPIDNGEPARAKVTTVGELWTLAWARDGGRRLEPFGDPFTNVKEALWVARLINERTGA